MAMRHLATACVLGVALAGLGCAATPVRGPDDPAVERPDPGVRAEHAAYADSWSGKWDGRWDVVLVVWRVTEWSRASVRYRWKEYGDTVAGDPWSRLDLEGRFEGGKLLLFSARDPTWPLMVMEIDQRDSGRAQVVGNFRVKRTADLRRKGGIE
jgi:hypothetical protein